MISLLSICTVFVWATVNIGQASACSGTEILKCVHSLEMLTSFQYSDPKTVCHEVHQAVECFERNIKKCPGPPHLLQRIREHFEYMKSMCDRNVPEEGEEKKEKEICSAEDIAACVSSLNSIQLSSVEMSMACLEIHNAVECVYKEMNTCPDYLRSYLDNAKQQLDMVMAWCEQHRPPTTTSLRPSSGSNSGAITGTSTRESESKSPSPQCDWSSIHQCVWALNHLLTGRHHSDIDLICREYDKSIQCLRKESVLCPNYTSSHLWRAQLLVDEVSIQCDRERPTHMEHEAIKCVHDDVLTTCLIHNQMPVTRVGERREPLGQDRICLLVGASESCITHKTRGIPSCSPRIANKMFSQLEEQKAQCKHLGYPINKALVTLPTTLLTLTLVSVPNILHHFL